MFLPGESQGWQSLVGCHLWGRRVGRDGSDLAAAAAADFSIGFRFWFCFAFLIYLMLEIKAKF